MHVLNACQVRLPGYRTRHDACHKDIFVKAVALHLTTVSEHKVDIVQGDGSTLRPDSVLIFDKVPIPNTARTEKVAMIVDFKCPYPAENFISRTHDRNVEHYASIAQWYRENGYRVSIETVIIPSIGPNVKHTYDTLRRIGFTAKVVNQLLAEMSIAVAKANQSTLASTLPAFRKVVQGPLLPTPALPPGAAGERAEEEA